MTVPPAYIRGADLPSFDGEDLIQLFEQRCARFGSLHAVTIADSTMTFYDLFERSRSFAGHLQSVADLHSGDRVAVMMSNCVEYVPVAWGVLLAGMVLVNTNPLYTSPEMLYQIRNSGARVLVTERACLAKLATVLEETAIDFIYIKEITDCDGVAPERDLSKVYGIYNLRAALAESGVYRRPDINGESLAMLQYTGGTTGLSKGAMLTHANLYANCMQGWLSLEDAVEGREIPIVPLPLYHIYAFAWSLITFSMHGSHVILIEDPRKTISIIEAMQRVKFTCFFGLNSLFVALIQHPDVSTVDFSRLHITLSGGAPLPIDSALRWEQLTGCVVHEGYGLTEASPIVCVTTEKSRKLGSVGRPVLGTELKLIDNEGNQCPSGQEGELCIRGPQIMHGYWNQEAETRAVLGDDGWLKTGDIAAIDDEGFVRIIDRKKDMVIISGFNVYPTEVEQTVSGHPAVIECAAAGFTDNSGRDGLGLFVVSAEETLTAAELQTYCRERLTAYKVPRRITFVRALPKTSVGKVLRRALHEFSDESTQGNVLT